MRLNFSFGLFCFSFRKKLVIFRPYDCCWQCPYSHAIFTWANNFLPLVVVLHYTIFSAVYQSAWICWNYWWGEYQLYVNLSPQCGIQLDLSELFLHSHTNYFQLPPFPFHLQSRVVCSIYSITIERVNRNLSHLLFLSYYSRWTIIVAQFSNLIHSQSLDYSLGYDSRIIL